MPVRSLDFRCALFTTIVCWKEGPLDCDEQDFAVCWSLLERGTFGL